MTLMQQLKEHNLKITKYRIALLEIFQTNHKVFTAEDLHLYLLKQYPSVAFSTVYRIINTFLRCHLIRAIILEDENKQYYALYEGHHKHHLICTQCKRIIPLKKCPVKALSTELETDYQFHIESHQLEFYGVCETCTYENGC
jgi:Fur family ferric uptake transcriptional regulator